MHFPTLEFLAGDVFQSQEHFSSITSCLFDIIAEKYETVVHFILYYNYYIRVISFEFLTPLQKTQKRVLINWEDLPEKKSFLLGNAQLAWRCVGVEGCGLGILFILILTLFSKWTSCQNCVQVLCSAQKKVFFWDSFT